MASNLVNRIIRDKNGALKLAKQAALFLVFIIHAQLYWSYREIWLKLPQF